MKKTLFRNPAFRMLLVTFFSIMFNGSFAAKEIFSNNAANPANGTSINVFDSKYSFMISNSNWSQFFVNNKIVNRVILSIDHSSSNFQAVDYSATVTLNIIYYTYTSGGFVGNLPITKTLIVNYSKGGNYNDKSIFEFEGGGNAMTINVGSVIINPGSAQANLSLEAQIEVERYYSFDPNFIPTGLNHNYLSATGELELQWNIVNGAEEYDLEWMYINDYDGVTKTSSLGASQLALDNRIFQFNSTRISTTINFYRIPLTYSKGYILYRVRAQGRTSANNYMENIAGKWSDDPGGWTSVATFPNKYPITAHQDNLNWQFSANYAEEGKSKVAVSYFDGSLRNRQVVSKLNTDNKTIAGETIYDHQGRGAVQVLPVPTGSSKIEFNSNFNLSKATSLPYSRNDFDLDGTNKCEALPGPMKTSKGASNYYSDQNPDKTLSPLQYLPDAKEYPFTQIQYTPDNTGRIRVQSGVGIDHQIGKGHETKYFYSQPFQEELDRVFGSEVGNEKHYKKNAVLDGNGQVSVSYLDPQGRVIATSLAGAAPLNLLGLTTSHSTDITVDLINKEKCSDNTGSSNELSLRDRNLKVSRQIFVDSRDKRHFYYKTDGTKYDETCNLSISYTKKDGSVITRSSSNHVCYDCVLDLNISLKDECGNEYIAGIGTAQNPSNPSQTIPSTSTVIGQDILDKIRNSNTVPFDPQDCSGTTPSFKYPLANTSSCDVTSTQWETNIVLPNGTVNPADLNVGTYSLNKILTVNQEALDYYTSDYFKNSKCLLDFDYFHEVEIDKIDVSGCNIKCGECAKVIGSYTKYSGSGCDPCLTTDEYQKLIDDCEENCEEESVRCLAAYENMLTDMSPTGQYGEIMNGAAKLDNEGRVIITAGTAITPWVFPLSVFNEGNLLPRKAKYKTDYDNHLKASVWNPNWRFPYNIDMPNLDETLKDENGNDIKDIDDNSVIVNKQFTYLDENGKIAFVKINSTTTPNVYSPAVQPGKKPIKLPDGALGIQPQFLANVVDFIESWEASWAQSLVAYHPEYCYYEFCQATPQSHNFDEKWLKYEELSKTISELFGNDNNVVINPFSIDPYFSEINSLSSTFTNNERQALRNAMTQSLNDYTTDKNGVHYSLWEIAYITAYCPNGNLASSYCPPCNPGKSAIINAVTANPENYDKWWNVFKAMYISAKQKLQDRAATLYAIRHGCYNGCIDDENFTAFKDGFYYNRFTATCSQSGCIGGCWLSNTFPFTFFHRFWWCCPTNFPCFRSSYYDLEQPCNWSRYYLYRDKHPRFPAFKDLVKIDALDANVCYNASYDNTTYDPNGTFESTNCPEETQLVLDEAKRKAELSIFQQCGKCPLAHQLEGFLNAMTQKKLLDATGRQLNCYSSNPSLSTPNPKTGVLEYPETGIPEFTPDLQDAIQDELAITTLGLMRWNMVSNSGSHLVARINIDGKTEYCNLELIFPSFYSSIYNFNDITKLCCMKYKNESPFLLTQVPNKNFEIKATVVMKPGDPQFIADQPDLTKEIILEGVSCINIGECTFDPVCTSSREALDLQTLFNALLYKAPAENDLLAINPTFASTSSTSLDGNQFDPIITNLLRTKLAASFGVSPSPDIIFSWQAFVPIGNTMNARISYGAYHCDFTFTLPASNPNGYTFNNILSFSNIKPDRNGSKHDFTITALVEKSGVREYILMTGTSACFNMGNCSFDLPAQFNMRKAGSRQLQCELTADAKQLQTYLTTSLVGKTGPSTDVTFNGCRIYLFLPAGSGYTFESIKCVNLRTPVENIEGNIEIGIGMGLAPAPLPCQSKLVSNLEIDPYYATQEGNQYNFIIKAEMNDGNILQVHGFSDCLVIGNCENCKPQEKVINGDFKAGRKNFSSQYKFVSCSSNTCLNSQGLYTIGTDASSVYTAFTGRDHTSGNGNFMIVNGTVSRSDDDRMDGILQPTSNNLKVWCQKIDVRRHRNYDFSAWISTLYPSGPAKLKLTVNGVQVGDIFTASSQTSVWTNFSAKWNSGTAITAEVCIVDVNTATIGNDFGLDDISFIEECPDEENPCDGDLVDGDGHGEDDPCAIADDGIIFPLKRGVAVATCYAPSSTDGTFGVIDVRNPSIKGAVKGQNWTPNMYRDSRWILSNMEQVFGIAIDNEEHPNIYLTATNIYNTVSSSGKIFKVDGLDGDLSVFANLQNSGPGLGNICYDRDHEQLFVTNFEDGKIYRLDMNGNILSTFDPLGSDNGVSGYAPLGQRLWGIAYYKNQVYFSVWADDGGRKTGNNNKIYSVNLSLGNGDFTGAETLEITIPFFRTISGQSYSNPIADISFSPDGKMLLGERTMVADNYSCAHEARVLEYMKQSGAWQPSLTNFIPGGTLSVGCTSFSGGSINGSNGAGGITYTTDGNVISSGDHFGLGIYGLVIMPKTGNSSLSNAASENYYIDLGSQKTSLGDVEVNLILPPGCIQDDLMCDLPEFPRLDIPDDCVEQQLDWAKANAQEKYDAYIAAEKQKFQENYIAKCLNVYEDFLMKYKDSEHHTTLYYYDQAGNLVRTIPPEGVVKITDANKLQQVKTDRANSTRTVFTEHTMATTYKYNSLNQLVAQTTPDHQNLKIFETTNINIPSSYSVKGIQMNGNTGYLVANDGNDGHIFVTNDGGATWTEVNDIGIMDLNDVVYESVTSSIAYSCGQNGTVLKTIDNGSNWIMKPVPTNGELVQLYYDGAKLRAFESNGNIWESSDGAESWVSPASTTLSSLLGGGILKDVHFASGGTGFAVSNNGKIFSSTDAGVSWTEVTANNVRTVGLNAVAKVPSSTDLFAVGADGTIVKGTLTTSSNWQEITNNSEVAFSKLHFKNGSSGCAIGSDGKLYTITSGGGNIASSTVDASLTSEEFIDLSFLYTNSSAGYAVSKTGKVAKTTDGGANWTHPGNTPVAMTDAKAIHFATNTEGYVGGTGGQLYKTTDGGVNWSAISTSNISGGSNKDIIDLHFRDVNNGALLMADGNIWHSTTANNATPNWDNPIGIPTSAYTQFNFPDANNGFAVSNNKVIKTKNISDYSQWSTASTGLTPGSNSLQTVLFDANLLNGVVAGNNGEIWQTDNGGTSWTNQSAKVILPSLNGVFRVGLNAGFAMGADGTVLKLASSGGVWQTQVTGTSENLYSGYFSSVSEGTVAGNNGKILNYNGTTWISATSGTTKNLRAMMQKGTTRYAVGAGFIVISALTSNLSSWTVENPASGSSELRGVAGGTVPIAVGQGGKILINSSGMIWTTVNALNPPKLNATHMLPSGIGYAVGENGTIMKTTDNGLTWVTQVSNTTAQFNSVYFIDDNRGGAVGNNGTVRGTTNGGTSWATINLGTTANLNDVHGAPDGLYAVIVGDGGATYVSTNGGTTWQNKTTNVNALYGTPPSLRGVYLVDNSFGYAVGSNGTILKIKDNGTLFEKKVQQPTTKDWVLYLTGTTRTLRDVRFTDYVTGYAVGDNGVMLKTVTGGETWGLENLGTPVPTNNLFTLTFNEDPTHIFVGGTGSYVNHIHDFTDLFATIFFYDKLGRLVASQNAKQLNKSKTTYSYTVYDDKGRITEVGEIAGTSTLTNEATAGIGEVSVKDDAAFSAWIAGGVKTEITKTIYDVASCNVGFFVQENLRTRVSGVSIDEDGDGQYEHATHYSYDIHGNVKSILQDYPLLALRWGMYSQQYKQIDYEYDLVSGNVKMVKYQAGNPDQFFHRYFYDADNRITHAETSRDGIVWDRDGKYFYYPHGPLARTEIGQLKVQGVDYAYTIQGWMKGVNSNTVMNEIRDIGKDGEITNASNLNKNVGRDEYGFTLGYYEGDYSAINSPQGASHFEATLTGDLLASTGGPMNPIENKRGLFNGNISSMVTGIRQLMGATGTPHGNAYRYDQLNRLITTTMFDNVDMTNNQWGGSGTGTGSGDYSEYFDYDKNGNIKILNRNAYTTATSVNTNTMDRFEYKYENKANGYERNTNKLRAVLDNGDNKDNTNTIVEFGDIHSGQTYDVNNHATDNYNYDELGNLIKDKQEQIKNIQWTVYGKVKKVERDNIFTKNEMEFGYDASGNRIMKIEEGFSEFAPGGWKWTFYVRDAGGNIMATYTMNVTSSRIAGGEVDRNFYLDEYPIYGSSRIGILKDPLLLQQRCLDGCPSLREFPIGIGEVLHDSPLQGTVGEGEVVSENHLGEFVVLKNMGNETVNMENAVLRNDINGTEVAFAQTEQLGPNELMVVAYGNAADRIRFQQTDMIDESLMDRTDIKWKWQTTMTMPDEAGSIVLEQRASPTEKRTADRVDYSRATIIAENTHITEAQLLSPDRQTPQSIQRTRFDRNQMGTFDVSEFEVAPRRINIQPIPKPRIQRSVTTIHTMGKKEYELTNHLGNVLVTVSDKKTPNETTGDKITDFYTANVLSAYDYYAFGMIKPNAKNLAGDYRFGFNGKEEDNEVKGMGNSLDFGERSYDPRKARWISIDPKFKKYPAFSSYSSFGNNPIKLIDIKGETIILAGEKKDALNDMRSLIPQSARNYLQMYDDGVLYWFVNEDKLKEIGVDLSDPGFQVVNELMKSTKLYEYRVADKVQVAEASNYDEVEIGNITYSKAGTKVKRDPQTIDHLKNGSIQSTLATKSVKGLVSDERPKSQQKTYWYPIDEKIDAQLTFVTPTNYRVTNRSGNIKPRPAYILHEMLEMWLRENQGYKYLLNPDGTLGGSHNKAEGIEKTLPESDERRDVGSEGAVGPIKCAPATTMDPGCCFVAGTKILMANNMQKNIEEVRQGDTIKTIDLNTFKLVNSRVEKVSSPLNEDIIQIAFADGTKNTNTFDHSYYVKGKGWCSYKPILTKKRYGIDAKQFQKGDFVYKIINGTITETEVVNIDETIGQIKTYNVYTEGNNNNYFANSIIVHNETLTMEFKEKVISLVK